MALCLRVLLIILVTSVTPTAPSTQFKIFKSMGENTCKESPCQLLQNRREAKRAASIVNIAIRGGKRAVLKLLQDSKQLSENTLYRNYVKSGGITRAKSDFEALRPNNVLEHITDDGSQVRIGQVGDRNVIISNKGKNGQPIVMIQRRTYPSDQQGPPYWHHITYYT